jgi:hypothetical protein
MPVSKGRNSNQVSLTPGLHYSPVNVSTSYFLLLLVNYSSLSRDLFGMRNVQDLVDESGNEHTTPALDKFPSRFIPFFCTDFQFILSSKDLSSLRAPDELVSHQAKIHK